MRKEDTEESKKKKKDQWEKEKERRKIRNGEQGSYQVST